MGLILYGEHVFSQTPPPPNNGESGTSGDTPVGGGAPIHGGIFILLAAGSAYAYRKYRTKDSKLEN